MSLGLIEKVFEGKELELKPEEKKKIVFKDLFFDVFDFDDATSETIRLSASTLEELFKETKYKNPSKISIYLSSKRKCME